jgi:hypothetical protein
MKRWMRLGMAATIATTLVTSVASGVDARPRSDQETYTSPTFGITLDYDASVWSVFQESEADAENPGDVLGLEIDELAGGFVIDIHDRETDAGNCLDETVAYGVGDDDDARPIENEDGEPIEGSSRGSAYAAYTSVSEGGNNVGGYFECQEFGDELGVVVFMLFVDSREFDEAYEMIQPIIESVDDSDAHSANQGDGEDRDRDEEDENDDRPTDEDEDDRANDDDKDDDRANGDDEDDDRSNNDDEEEDAGQNAEIGVYESELYGYTLPYNAENWTPEEQETNGANESFKLIGPHNENVTVLTFAAEGARPIDYTEYYAESFAEHSDLHIELYEDPDTGDTLERSNLQESYALYTFEHDGGEFLLYTHAVTSEDGRFVVLLAGLSLESSYDLLEDEVFPLLDQIEFE